MNYPLTLAKVQALLPQGHAVPIVPIATGRDDQRRLVAQTLVDILPPDDGERRLLEGFLAGRESLPEVVRQERLL